MNNKINEIIGRLGVNKEAFYQKLIDWEAEGFSEEELVYISLLYEKCEDLIDISVKRSFEETITFFESNIEKDLIDNIKMNVIFYLNKDFFIKENLKYIIEKDDYIVLKSVNDKYKKYFKCLEKKPNLYLFFKKSCSDFLQKGDSFIFDKSDRSFKFLGNNKVVYNIKGFLKNEEFIITNFIIFCIYLVCLLPPFLSDRLSEFFPFLTSVALIFATLANPIMYYIYKSDIKEVKEKIDLFDKLSE